VILLGVILRCKASERSEGKVQVSELPPRGPGIDPVNIVQSERHNYLEIEIKLGRIKIPPGRARTTEFLTGAFRAMNTIHNNPGTR
jgi:hypothetical protein